MAGAEAYAAPMPVSNKILIGPVHKELAACMLKDKGRELAGAIRDGLPEGYEYLVVLKENDTLAFFSDCSREQAIRSLREVLAELEGS